MTDLLVECVIVMTALHMNALHAKKIPARKIIMMAFSAKRRLGFLRERQNAGAIINTRKRTIAMTKSMLII
jgi:hypothetical protein